MSLLRRRLVKQSVNSSFQIISNRSFSTVKIPQNPRRTNKFDKLINEAGGSGDFETVRRLLNNRIVLGSFNTSDTFKFLTNTASYSSALEDLRRVLPKIDGGFSRKNAYDILISRLCKLGRTDDALIVIGDMSNGRLGLTPSTFHPILCALTRKNKIEEAWRVVESMRSRSVPMDVTSYNYFLTSHCYDGELEPASEVIRKIEEEGGISTDSRSYDALVLGACRAGKVEAAMAMLRRMEEEGVTVLYSTHAHVISGLVEGGYYALGLEFVITCAGKDLRLDAESFGCLAGKLVKRKRFEEAKVVLKEMVARGLRMSDELRQFYESHVRNYDDDVYD
ncbi:PREDICTED: pentatricopeptide repeat-containing protein At2g40240, mitochondrial-like [Camelina sativa]|uniref:Pentatricopeptide repeat-containing protein At2g40240, mitochondrial-like n=1 Tax=Camelina sativa TaxID=90675 RepID=A0ABM0Z0Y5_CAMSA|nr:PREDICTED: pentatricopeptide repeat-containing protein At2g40240, mitochondrial-like [Camelina sativa]